MITMDMIGKVRRLRLRDKLSLSEIVRRTGISRNTIKKWVNQEAILKPPRYERVSSPGVLSRFEATGEMQLYRHISQRGVDWWAWNR